VALPADIVAAVASRLAAYAGLELPAWVVETRADARMEALALAPADYVALIGAPRGGSELDELIEAVRVGESRLFRHRAQIAALAETVAPALRAGGRRAVRVWSAGCAAGQEPYTLAAVLARCLPGSAISIIATDVSADALAVARGASYPAAALGDVPAEWRDAFVVDGDRLVVRPELAALVRFERANLIDGIAPRGCDLVWCRNVLIYFTPPARRIAIGRLVAATNPGGFLFVGYSESLRDVAELDAARTGDAVYYVRREAEAGAGVGAGAVPPRASAGERRTRPPPIDDDDRTPPPMTIPATPPPEDVLVLRGHPDARTLTADLTARLGLAGLVRLVVDLDGAELLGDELAPVLRRARAAAEAAGVELVLRTTRAGARRWLARHALEGGP
jgi:chemotaxis protein methyltransferase CheR